MHDGTSLDDGPRPIFARPLQFQRRPLGRCLSLHRLLPPESPRPLRYAVLHPRSRAEPRVRYADGVSRPRLPGPSETDAPSPGPRTPPIDTPLPAPECRAARTTRHIPPHARVQAQADTRGHARVRTSGHTRTPLSSSRNSRPPHSRPPHSRPSPCQGPRAPVRLIRPIRPARPVRQTPAARLTLHVHPEQHAPCQLPDYSPQPPDRPPACHRRPSVEPESCHMPPCQGGQVSPTRHRP